MNGFLVATLHILLGCFLGIAGTCLILINNINDRLEVAYRRGYKACQDGIPLYPDIRGVQDE